MNEKSTASSDGDEEKLPLLWHSNAPYTSTGYGQQTAIWISLLKEHYAVACSCFYGLEGNQLDLNGVRLYPGIPGTYGNEIITAHKRRHIGDGPGAILTLIDVWVLDPNIWRDLPVISWVPVDHEPPPPRVLDYFRNCPRAVPLAMSRFGEEQLREAGLDPLYCPHGIDTEVYAPVDDARKFANLPEQAFVCGLVAANKGVPSRKQIAESLCAFKAFRERHDDAVLYLHTELVTPAGLQIPQILEALDLPEKSIYITDQERYRFNPLEPPLMAAAYSSFDVLLNPSAGEGFGLPVLESQACGTPAIVTDFSAMPEVCGSGWRVGGQRVWTGQNSWQLTPNVEELVESLESAYARSAAEVEAMSKAARVHAEQYDARVVLTENMLPALEEAWSRLNRKTSRPGKVELPAGVKA